MKTSGRLLVVRVIVTTVTLFYGIVPVMMDVNDTHLLNPGWSPHARHHGAWFLSFSAAMAGVALFLLWVRKETMLPIVIGLMFVAGFWAATLLAPLYGGALVDTEGFEQGILGVDSNVMVFSVTTAFLLGSLFFMRRWNAER